MSLSGAYESADSGRVTITREARHTLIVVKGARHWGAAIFLFLWLIGWSIGGLFAIFQIGDWTRIGFEDLFLLIWLCGWAFGMVFAVTALLSLAFGRETLLIGNDGVTKRAEALFLRRTRNFDPYKIYDVQLYPASLQKPTNRGLMLPIMSDTGSVRFEYGAKTIRFGAELSPYDARRIVDEFSYRLGRRVLVDKGESK